MNRRLLDRILPNGPELLRRLALAEVLGPPPSSVARRKQMRPRPAPPRDPSAPPSEPGPEGGG